MMEAYRKNTGDHESEPLTVGGGTYAKMVDNILAFGALFAGIIFHDRFIGSGSRKEQEAECGIDADGIFETLCKVEKNF